VLCALCFVLCAASVCRSGAIYGSGSVLCKCMAKALLISHVDEWKNIKNV
jgi:hypothetical protein